MSYHSIKCHHILYLKYNSIKSCSDPHKDPRAHRLTVEDLKMSGNTRSSDIPTDLCICVFKIHTGLINLTGSHKTNIILTMTQFTLYIKPVNETFADVYKTAADAYNRTPPHERNSGMDLFCDAADIDTEYSIHAMLVGQGCHAAAFDEHGRSRAYWVVPQSSISRTPYRLANSLGLIDAGYRGIIKVPLSLTPDLTPPVNELCIIQIATPDLLPWHTVIVIDELPKNSAERSEYGIGPVDYTYFS
jgi:hypothetical protein